MKLISENERAAKVRPLPAILASLDRATVGVEPRL
jgi:hypothetical protein